MSHPAWGEWIEIEAYAAGELKHVSFTPHGVSEFKPERSVQRNGRKESYPTHGKRIEIGRKYSHKGESIK